MFNSVLLLRPPPWRWPSPISPRALRVLLLALAVIDDLGARVVIALFYSTGVSLGWPLLAVAASAARSLR